MKFYQVFSSLGSIIPIIFGIIFFNRHSDVIAKPFIFYLMFVLFLESLSLNLSFHSINNHFFYNCIDLITIVFFAFIFLKNGQNILGFISLAILFFTVYLTFSFNAFIFKQNNYLAIYSFIGITSAIQLFNYTKKENENSHKKFRFWFLSGILVATFPSITMYVFFDKIKIVNGTNILVKYYTFFTFIISTLQNILFSKAFTCKK